MSKQSQTANMKRLAELLSHDLGYIYGERESGPNGAKREFLTKGRAFMAALGKDLGFAEQKLSVNKAGIACSGEIYLQGLWPGRGGLYMWMEQDLMRQFCICYRSIRNIGDRTNGGNHFIPTAFLATGDYNALLDQFLEFKERSYERKAA